MFALRSMSLLLVRPCAHSVVRRNEVIADQNRIVSISDTSDHLPIDLWPPVSALIMCAQRVGEARRWSRSKRWWKRPRWPFGEQGIACFKVED